MEELDDIERVLDHAQRGGSMNNTASIDVQGIRPNPCEGCKPYLKGQCDQGDINRTGARIFSEDCAPYLKYLGYQEGLAECEARIHKKEQEIVEWLKIALDGCWGEGFEQSHYEGRRAAFTSILSWLQGKE